MLALPAKRRNGFSFLVPLLERGLIRLIIILPSSFLFSGQRETRRLSSISQKGKLRPKVIGKTIQEGKCTLKKSAESERQGVPFADCTSASLDPHLLISREHVSAYVHGSGSGCGADSLQKDPWGEGTDLPTHPSPGNCPTPRDHLTPTTW